jgi:O-antigen/teichoic acid export membrane protein
MSSTDAGRVGIGTHYLRYSTANILVMAAGLISFPVLTRLLDNTQYGILGYYETWVMMAVAVAKLGAQHAILRFYPFDGDGDAVDRFATNHFYLPLLVSSALWMLMLVVFASVEYAGSTDFSPVLWLAVLAIPLNVFASLVQMMLRAGERSGLLVVTRVSWRWLELLAMVGAVVLIERSALSAYGGKLLAAILVAAFYVRWVRRNLKFLRPALDPGEFRASLRYGLPLVANEVAMVALISIDRIMLKGLTNDFAAVGIYSIGYSLALQVSILMQATLSESFLPVANRTHETEGPAQVRALKRQVLLPMTYASIGIAAAIFAVGGDALVAISGPDKAASGIVFAWIGGMYALMPILDIAGYGLLLHKRSGTVLAMTAGAALLNIGLNLWLVPAYGVMGAVYATAICYALLGTATCLLCPREFLQLPDLRSLALSLAAAAAFLWAVWGNDLFGLTGPWLRLFAAGGLWLLLYVLPVLAFDLRLARMLPGVRRLLPQRLRG